MQYGKLLGWEGIGENRGKYVPAEEGLSYAMQQVGVLTFYEDAPDAGEFKDMLVDWFFSGNWIEKHESLCED